MSALCFVRRRLRCALAGYALMLVLLPQMVCGDTIRLESVEVIATPDEAVYVEQEEDLAERLQAVPGGTNLVNLKDATRLSTLSDALNYQPGVIVQEFFGGLDQPRLNVRGSGIQGNPVARGVLLRQDHLPLNDADGSFIIGILNLRDTALVSVHRGANSRVPGSFTLGGDINFISHHGEVPGRGGQSRWAVDFETGSFGRQMIHSAWDSGAGEMSFHGSFTEESAAGYRHHSASRREQYHGNLAAKLSQRVSNFTYLTYTDMAFEMPFVLPKAQAEHAPETVFGDGVPVDGIFPDDLPIPDFIDVNVVANAVLNMYRRDPHRQTLNTRLANRTTYWDMRSEHSLGWYWQHSDDAFVDPFSHIETDAHTYGLQWEFGADPVDYFHYQMGIDVSRSDMPRVYTGNHPFEGSKITPAFAELDLQAENKALSLAFDLVVVPGWTLTGQWQRGHSSRIARLKQGEDRYDGRWNFSLSKLGVIYEPADGGPRWFANVSESIELPTFWEIVGVEVNPLLTWMSRASLQALRPQDAVTLELGVDRKIHDSLRWELALFRSHVQHELISTASQFGVIAQTHNYPGDTVHQGIEWGMGGTLDLQRDGSGQRQLLYRGSWTYSDFYFRDGEFAGNRIAGVPENLILLEVLLRQGNLRAGPHLRWLPDDNPVDHANTLGQGSHLIWGFNVDYRYSQVLRAYLSLDNLLDDAYNASFVVRARSDAHLPTYLPGNGFGAVAGVQVRF